MRHQWLACLLLGLVGLTSPGQAQQIFDVLPPPSAGTFSSTVIFPDSSQFSSTGLTLSAGSTVQLPDLSLWSSGGLSLAQASSVRFPDTSTWTATQLRFSSIVTVRGPDGSVWSQAGLVMASAKPVYLASGDTTAPSLSFADQ